MAEGRGRSEADSMRTKEAQRVESRKRRTEEREGEVGSLESEQSEYEVEQRSDEADGGKTGTGKRRGPQR